MLSKKLYNKVQFFYGNSANKMKNDLKAKLAFMSEYFNVHTKDIFESYNKSFF